MQDPSSDLSLCPSFNSYSSDRLADTAARVSTEFAKLGLESSDDFHGSDGNRRNDNENEDDDFEFVSFSTAGDEVLLNRPIGPVFPVFNRDLLRSTDSDDRLGHEDEIPCPPSSSSEASSEADELDGIPAGTYCVWTPNRVPATPGRCKKSKSTGSASKRWSLSFRELLRRCNSDGKESFVFLTPSSSSSKKMMMEGENNSKVDDQKITAAVNKAVSSTNNEGAKIVTVKGKTATAKTAVAKVAGNDTVAAAHEVFYVRNRALNRNAEKRRSFLPYRQDLVGFFANVNTMGRTFPPF